MPNPIRISDLEKVLRSPNAAKLGKSIIPALKPRDLNEDVEYIIKNNAVVAEYVRRNPQYRERLLEAAQSRYKKVWPYLVGAGLIDNYDFLTSVAGLSMDVAGVVSGGAGNLGSGIEELIELVPKIGYVPLYAKGMNDYKAIPYFTAIEAASFIPFVGDLIDMKPLYTQRATKRFQEIVTDDFLASMKAKKPSDNVIPFPDRKKAA